VNGDVMITQVEAGSQAEQQGLVADLVFFQVAGQSVRGMDRAAVMERIKGAERPITFVFESQATAKLAAKLEELRGVQERLRDERCQRDDAVPQCRAAIEAGRTCAILYESAFNMLLTGEAADGLDTYNHSAAALRANIPQPIQCEQTTKDLANLYREAGAVRMRSRKVIEGLGAHTNAKLQPMGPLKRTSRASEKVVLAPSDAGGAEKVCDIVRDMFVCASMMEVAGLLDVINGSAEIELVRFKDRFEVPSGGWRDAMINYRLKGSTHVCELQIGHEKMLLQRKNMGGHVAYVKERNARELLEFLGVKLLEFFGASASE